MKDAFMPSKTNWFLVGGMATLLVIAVVLVLTVLRTGNLSDVLVRPKAINVSLQQLCPAGSDCADAATKCVKAPSCCSDPTTCTWPDRGYCTDQQCNSVAGQWSGACTGENPTNGRCTAKCTGSTPVSTTCPIGNIGSKCTISCKDGSTSSQGDCIKVDSTPNCRCGHFWHNPNPSVCAQVTGAVSATTGATSESTGAGSTCVDTCVNDPSHSGNFSYCRTACANGTYSGGGSTCVDTCVNDPSHSGNFSYCRTACANGTYSGGGGVSTGTCFDSCFSKTGGNGSLCTTACTNSSVCVSGCSSSANYTNCVFGCIYGSAPGACSTSTDCAAGQTCQGGVCTPVSSGTDEVSQCWGNGGGNGKCYDCNGDGEINSLDFSCFRACYQKTFSASDNPTCFLRPN